MIITNKRETAKPEGIVKMHTRDKINMYDQHPNNVISLHEFHSVALNRLQVLRKIEFMHDANANEAEIAAQINKYAY